MAEALTINKPDGSLTNEEINSLVKIRPSKNNLGDSDMSGICSGGSWLQSIKVSEIPPTSFSNPKKVNSPDKENTISKKDTISLSKEAQESLLYGRISKWIKERQSSFISFKKDTPVSILDEVAAFYGASQAVAHDIIHHPIRIGDPEFDHWCIFLTDQVSPQVSNLYKSPPDSKY